MKRLLFLVLLMRAGFVFGQDTLSDFIVCGRVDSVDTLLDVPHSTPITIFVTPYYWNRQPVFGVHSQEYCILADTTRIAVYCGYNPNTVRSLKPGGNYIFQLDSFRLQWSNCLQLANYAHAIAPAITEEHALAIAQRHRCYRTKDSWAKPSVDFDPFQNQWIITCKKRRAKKVNLRGDVIIMERYRKIIIDGKTGKVIRMEHDRHELNQDW